MMDTWGRWSRTTWPRKVRVAFNLVLQYLNHACAEQFPLFACLYLCLCTCLSLLASINRCVCHILPIETEDKVSFIPTAQDLD